jgi:hypothetical protein
VPPPPPLLEHAAIRSRARTVRTPPW